MKFNRVSFFAFITIVASSNCLQGQQTVPLESMVVSATRSPQAVDKLPMTVDVFTGDYLNDSPALTLDDNLKSLPGFSLFRRSGSLTANPTAQGVSLRGLGPSGASRSLVLLDGVPLNDPFGGWVTWSKLPRESLSRVEVVRGAGSGTWGSAALGGAIQLFSKPLEKNEVQATGILGDYGTRSGEVMLTGVKGADSVQVGANDFITSGFPLVAASQRGPIDRNSATTHQWAQAKWQHRFDVATFALNARYFTEDRNNGTPLQRNHSREGFVSATAEGAAQNGPAWSAMGYVQKESFSSFFTSVNATRTAETPANNQFDVPATATGGSVTAIWQHANDAATTIGADARWVRGETREDASFVSGRFTQLRYAGGQQYFNGFFIRHERMLAAGWRGSLGVRADYWSNYDGHRREYSLLTGVPTRLDSYAAKNGTELNPSAGLVWRPASWIRARAAAYRAFRLPTLNEYYRPFRVGNNITEANPNLAVETLDGGEAGLDLGDPRAGVTVTGFVNELHNAVGNVTVAQGPGNIPGFGVVPAGGLAIQRQNLSVVRVQGLEASAHWLPIPKLRLEVSYLLDDAKVAAAVQSSSVGKQLPEVPRHNLVFSVDWRAPGDLHVNGRLRWVSSQFDDDQNTLKLASATTVDLAVSRRFGRTWELFLSVENLLNAQVETGLGSVTGPLNVGPPRFTHGGVRWAW
jgi:outer membrane receptor protein involved in Fe transport